MVAQTHQDPNFENPLVEALKACKLTFIITFLFSFGVNVLNLISSVYVLQVLDRVLGSNNLKTLTMLVIIFSTVYLALHLLQVARSFTLIKIGEWLDAKITPKLFSHAVESSAVKLSMGASQSMREFSNVKSFLTSVGINSLFDAPWSIIYILVVFFINPWLGWITTLGAAIMLVMAFINAYAIDSTLAKSNEVNIKGHYAAEIATRNAETVQAMGMIKNVQGRWAELNKKSIELQSTASYRNGMISNITRFLRVLLQVSTTAVGAYIAVDSHGQLMTGGTMIAVSILAGKALGPFDQAIEVWKQVTSALKSYKKIKASFDKEALRREGMPIPNPVGKLTVENVFFAPPPPPGDQPKYTLKGLNFTLEAGKSLAIIGPSAAGKSTLSRLLVGAWKPTAGSVRLDGSDVFTWKRDDFGKHVGYLSQNVELFTGSIKENIARMSEKPEPAEVITAAKLAGAHDMISRLPHGYESDIGLAGSLLSGGQKQRVGLSRAFYGNPKLIVLDEPNSNLDEKGEQALVHAITEATKKHHSTVIVISHRPSILAFVDMIMIVQDGMIVAYGPRDEIMAKLTQAAKTHQPGAHASATK